MKKARLIINLPDSLLAKIKMYAKHNPALYTQLIKRMPLSGFKDVPIVQQLTGILPQNISSDGYKYFLEEKYHCKI